MKLKEKIEGMKIYLNKRENELNDAKKDKENLLIQVKELVNQCEKYAKKKWKTSLRINSKLLLN